jgi:hypothetical protein
MEYRTIRSETPGQVKMTAKGTLTAEIPLSIDVIRALDSEANDAMADVLEELASNYRASAVRWRQLEQERPSKGESDGRDE